MKTKGRKGFTLVEVILAAAIGAIMLLASGTVLVSGQTFFNNALEKTNLQRDAANAMLTISHSIKAGRSASVEGDGKAVRIDREADWIRFFYPPGSGELKCTIEGPKTRVIIENVEDVQFNVEGNKVTIDLKLKKDNLQNHFVSTVMIRNYGE